MPPKRPVRKAPARKTAQAAPTWQRWAALSILLLAAAAIIAGYTWQARKHKVEDPGVNLPLSGAEIVVKPAPPTVSAPPPSLDRVPVDIPSTEGEPTDEPIHPYEPAVPEPGVPGVPGEPAAPAEPAAPLVPLAPSRPGESLAPAPSPELMEKSELGILPKIGGDGIKPWHYYARPFARSDRTPMIVLMVTGLGASQSMTDLAMQLPSPVSLSFSPYAKGSPLWAQSARQLGHEVFVELPLEPSLYPVHDPGPYAMLTGSRREINEQRLQWVLTRFPGYVGLTTGSDEVITANQETFKPIAQSLNARGLMLVVSKPDSGAEWTSGVLPSVLADTMLSAANADAPLADRLTEIEEKAKKQGVVLVVVEPSPALMQGIKRWSESLEARGFVLAPVSALAKMRFS